MGALGGRWDGVSMLTILTIFKRVLAVFVGTALFFLMTVVFVDVILRNVFNAPLAAGTELTELLMGAMAFASFPLLTLSLGQICVELWQLDENSVMARTINFVGSLLTAPPPREKVEQFFTA